MNNEMNQTQEVMIVLNDGHTTASTFYNAIKSHVEVIIPAIERGLSYTLEMMCDREFWNNLNNDERQKAGRCLAHMVTKREFPLVFAPCGRNEALRYELA